VQTTADPFCRQPSLLFTLIYTASPELAWFRADVLHSTTVCAQCRAAAHPTHHDQKGTIMSSIGSIGSSTSSMAMMQGMRPMRRPDPAEMAENLFSKLDTAGQGYIEKTDLQSAFDSISTGTDVDSLFTQLDTDSDGKITKDEFSSNLSKLTEQFDQQFQGMRMEAAMQGMGGMPPPPPPADEEGFTKEELTAQLEEIGTTDSQRSSLISSVIENFEAADTNSDGKVSFQEAMAYQESSGSTNTNTATASSEDAESQLMLQIMRLMQAYGLGAEDDNSASLLSVSV
jgi:Ca2+-binding EF-hand superfamily protein